MKYLMPLVMLLLCSCSTMSYYQSTSYVPYQGYTYDEYDGYYGPDSMYFYGSGGSQQQGYYGQNQPQKNNQGNQITVPNSYYSGGYNSPEPSQTRDEQWVSRQNPNGYTIQISQGNKAYQVAKDLMKAPKSNRTAAVPTASGYVGVYGSYPTYEQAQHAYDNLPANLRKNATIKSWGSVQ